MYCKLNKYKYMWEIYNNEHITYSLHILYIYSEVEYKPIFQILIYAQVDQATLLSI